MTVRLSAAETVELIRLADKAERNSQKWPENNALIHYVEELLQHARAEGRREGRRHPIVT